MSEHSHRPHRSSGHKTRLADLPPRQGKAFGIYAVEDRHILLHSRDINLRSALVIELANRGWNVVAPINEARFQELAKDPKFSTIVVDPRYVNCGSLRRDRSDARIVLLSSWDNNALDGWINSFRLGEDSVADETPHAVVDYRDQIDYILDLVEGRSLSARRLGVVSHRVAGLDYALECVEYEPDNGVYADEFRWDHRLASQKGLSGKRVLVAASRSVYQAFSNPVSGSGIVTQWEDELPHSGRSDDSPNGYDLVIVDTPRLHQPSLETLLVAAKEDGAKFVFVFNKHFGDSDLAFVRDHVNELDGIFSANDVSGWQVFSSACVDILTGEIPTRDGSGTIPVSGFVSLAARTENGRDFQALLHHSGFDVFSGYRIPETPVRVTGVNRTVGVADGFVDSDEMHVRAHHDA